MSRMRQIRIESHDQPKATVGMEVHRFPVRVRDTGGRLAISLVELPASQESPLLRHTAEDLLYCVIDGLLEIECAVVRETLGPGDIAYIPRGCEFRTRSSSPSKVLVAFAPGTVQEAFIALGGSSQTAVQDEFANELSVWDVTVEEGPLQPTSVRQPTIVRANEGERYWLAGDEYTIKVNSSMTGQRFCVVHFRIPPGAGPLAHTHSRDEEIFYITKGRASFWSEGGVLEGSEGDTILLPRRIPHAFRNRTAEETEFMAFFTPAGFDTFVRTAGVPAKEGESPPVPDDAELARLAAASIDYGLQIHPEIEW
ncbi:MAG: cupin domain-containing protein [Phycisphaerales bacterium]